MDWPTFLIAVIKALAWPAAAVLAVWLFRRPLGSLVQGIGRVRYKELTIDFTRRVRAVKAEVERAHPKGTCPQPSTELAHPEDWLFELAEISPRFAIAGAWREVELAANEAIRVKERQLVKGEWVFPVGLPRQLQNLGILDDQLLHLFVELHQLRNNALHDQRFAIDHESVQDYIRLAITLSYILYGSTIVRPGDGPLAQAAQRLRRAGKADSNADTSGLVE